MKIINIFAGPGTGKSTFAAYLYAKLKSQNKSVELVTEYAKNCVYDDRSKLLISDQLYVFAKQNHRLEMLKNKVDFVITDSPILLSTIYGDLYHSINLQSFNELVLEKFRTYENINIFLERNENLSFDNNGRLQNQDESKQIDNLIKNYLKINNINYFSILVNNLEKMFKDVQGKING